MRNALRVVQGIFIVALIAQAAGCLVAEPRHEGYYDRDHNRYWHERRWHDCGERDEHCRY